MRGCVLRCAAPECAAHCMPAASPPTIGPYRLLRTLGRGSMGVVHLALDTAAQRHVALKTLPLPPDAADDDPLLQRFLGEVQAASRLSHPDIVTLHGAGRAVIVGAPRGGAT
jgi:eukaryotic-like serine/threonine-protein kinase